MGSIHWVTMVILLNGVGRYTCISVVTRVEKPKPWMIIVPKLEIPPFGILAS